VPEQLSPAVDPHASIAAVIQHLMIQHEKGGVIDIQALLTVLAALNELCAVRPQSIAATGMLRGALNRLGVS
jgi:hypothetical protein